MNNIVITNSSEFQKIIDSLESSKNTITDLFDREKENVKNVNETDTWTGLSATAFYNKYVELNNNYDNITNSLDVYIRFLKKTLNDYTRLEKEINNNIDNVASSLDVNS